MRVQAWEERAGETVGSHEGREHSEVELQKVMKERTRSSNLAKERGSLRAVKKDVVTWKSNFILSIILIISTEISQVLYPLHHHLHNL